MTLLRVNSGLHRQVFETDHWGNTVYPDKAKTINVCVSNELILTDGRMPFLVVVKIKKSQLQAGDDADAIAINWLKHSLPSFLAAAHYWDFFKHTWIDGDASGPDSEKFKSLEIDITLNERTAKQLSEAVTHLSLARTAFDSAKKRLAEFVAHNTPLGFEHSVSEARPLFNSVERTLSAAADIGGYSPRDARSAWSDYQELSRRKMENNHNYQCALSSLRQFVYGVNFPTYWGKRPDI